MNKIEIEYEKIEQIPLCWKPNKKFFEEFVLLMKDNKKGKPEVIGIIQKKVIK